MRIRFLVWMKTGEWRSDPPAAMNASDQGEADLPAILAEDQTAPEPVPEKGDPGSLIFTAYGR